MVVVTPVLVVEPQQKGVRPGRSVHDSVDHIRGEALPDLNVLWVLLRAGREVGVDNADRRQLPGGHIGKEPVGVA
jgi:hypothetical protein